MKFLLYNLLFICLLSGCKTIQVSNTPVNSSSDFIPHGKLFTAIWMQRSAEYKALCEQAYNLAELRLNESLQKPSDKPLAVITDIDETALDNSPYAIHRALQGKDFDNASWSEWVKKADADTIPGALTFFKNAAAKSVTVFYVTNRNEKEREATLRNLLKFGFPNADEEHLLTMTTTSGKEPRRSDIAQKFNVVLLIGDNLGDFSVLFDKKPGTERTANVLNNRHEFGKRFIVIPNPNYGDWEGSLYKYNYSLTPAQKDSAWKANATYY